MMARSAEFDVVGVGFSCLDTLCLVSSYPPEGGKVLVRRRESQVGGQTFTALGALSRLGRRVALATCMGQDPDGDRIEEAIHREGIIPSGLVRRAHAPTAHAFLVIPEDRGERTVFWQRDPLMNLRGHEIPAGFGGQGRVLLIDGHETDAALEAAGQARAAGRLVVLDGEWLPQRTEELLSLVDVAIVSEDFGERTFQVSDPRRVLVLLRKWGVRFALVTLGEHGALALDDEGELVLPPHPVRPVDTTGAGDLFHAGFIHGVLSGWEQRQSAAFANAFAALSVTRPGGLASAPDEAEALALLARDTQDG